MEQEYDVTRSSWDIYRCMYKDHLHICPDSIIKKGTQRAYIKSSFIFNGKKSEELAFSGETDFNFSRTKIFGYGRSRYEHFKKLLGKTDVYHIHMLDTCCDKFHSQENISLMPKTGSLQLVKKCIGNDRLDVFVWCLNEYYQHRSSLIYNFCSYENLNALKSFLELFQNIHEYCKVIYCIDSKLTDDLVDSGRKPIDSAKRAIEYMELAHAFWRQKETILITPERSQLINQRDVK